MIGYVAGATITGATQGIRDSTLEVRGSTPESLVERGLDRLIGFRTDDVFDLQILNLGSAATEPCFKGLVAESIPAVGIHVTDQLGNGFGNQPKLLFTLTEGLLCVAALGNIGKHGQASAMVSSLVEDQFG